jgi:hypothetical protein
VRSQMKQCLLLFVFFATLFTTKAQKVDSIYFNLYTDSLKKGTYNYINVDGKLADGRWLPMTEKEIILSSSGGSFEGNSLFIDSAFKDARVTVRATLKNNPAVFREVTIYIKTTIVEEKLKTAEELMKEWEKKGQEKKKKKTKDTTGLKTQEALPLQPRSTPRQ